MGFCIQYRSTESMHPATAYAVEQSADHWNSQFAWSLCEPVILKQRTDGRLVGQSDVRFECAAELVADDHSLPEAILMTLIEVLCRLSFEHAVDWEVNDGEQTGLTGQIREGVADESLVEQIETLDGIGDLFEVIDEQDDPWVDSAAILRPRGSAPTPASPNGRGAANRDDPDDEGPHLIKFPGTD